MAIGTQSYPAPVGGLNDRDALSAMPPQDAVILENWWPYPSKCAIRKGSSLWTYPYTNPVESLIEYAPVSGANKLFAASGTSIYDITSSGTSTAVVTGKTNSRWQDVAITTPGGNFQYLFNGVDAPMLYNGTTWTAITGASTPAITGVTTTNLVQACLWKNRLIMTERGTLKAWYLPVQSVGGAAQPLDIGSICVRGGSLTGVFNWTIDGGQGVDDQLVFITSNGEVVVYQGSDPANAATFNLIGVYYIGRPVGRRCATKFRGDLYIICEDGVFPLSQALQSGAIDQSVAITNKIQNTISDATSLYKNNFGWQLESFPDMNMLILNVPVDGVMNIQYVQNTITGAWTKFTQWDASCWKDTSSAGLLFGSNNSVTRAWNSNTDAIVVGATPQYNQIVADGLASFQYFQSQTYGKFFTLVRPYLSTDGRPSILYGLNINLAPAAPSGSFSYTPPIGMVWGSMIWGQASFNWGGGLIPLTNWNTVGAYATNAAIRLKIQGNSSNVEWSATDYCFKGSQSVL